MDLIQPVDAEVIPAKKIPIGKFFVIMESTNASALHQALDEVLDFFFNLGRELGLLPAENLEKNHVFHSGVNQNKVIVTINPLHLDAAAPQFRLFNRAMVNLQKYGFEALLKLKTDMTLKSILAKISRIQPEMSQDEAEALRDETNLFRFFLTMAPTNRHTTKRNHFLKGFTFALQVNGNDQVRNTIMNKLFKEQEPQILQDKTLYFLYLCFRNMNGKLKMSPEGVWNGQCGSEDTYELFMEWLNKKNPDIPDGSDLVDFLGELYAETQFHDMVRNVPALSNLVEALKAHGSCTVDVGYYVTGTTTMVASFKTEGVHELYELISQGMAEEEVAGEEGMG